MGMDIQPPSSKSYTLSLEDQERDRERERDVAFCFKLGHEMFALIAVCPD